MRQLEGSECSYADYEERARQLELQRPGWDGSTQTEWRRWQLDQHEAETNWRRELLSSQTNASAGVPAISPGELLAKLGGADDDAPRLKVQSVRREVYGRMETQLEIFSPERRVDDSVASPAPGSPNASYVSQSGFSLLGDSLDWLPPIQNTSSYELERAKALMDAAQEAFYPTDKPPRKMPSLDGMLLTRMHDLLADAPLLQKRLMGYLAHITTRHKWDERRQKRRSLAPHQCTLRVVCAQGLKKADSYDGSDPYVLLFWNGQLIGRTKVVLDSENPVWDCEIPLLVPRSGHGKREFKLQVFDHDDEEGDNGPNFMGQVLFDGVDGGIDGEATTPVENARGDLVERGLPVSSPTQYTLQKDKAHDVVHHTSASSYKDPYNAMVGGTLTLEFGPHGHAEVTRSIVNGKMAEEVVQASSGYLVQASVIAPLDFSFWELTEMPSTEKATKQFRQNCAKNQILPWNLEDEEFGPDWSFKVVDCVRLANNRLETIEGLPAALGDFLFMGNARVLHSLDLSFNGIRHLDKHVLESFPNLATLHLHTNLIEDFSEVKKLARLKLLDKLTLQNNPLQTGALQSMAGSSKGIQEYRIKVVATIPWLKELDFSTVTGSEHHAALTHRQNVQKSAEERKLPGPHFSPLPSPLKTMLGRQAGFRRGAGSPTKR